MNAHQLLMAARKLETCMKVINEVKGKMSCGRAESHLDESALNLQSSIDYILIELKEVM